ncbi:hypothetical protein AQUCO_02200150v1 [Aquilegia coerulea]|uniref:Uncharacterized protein n=1 Tax=Aquilegia coerulea TaxID=218851 RepID=A0A2G5DDI1_AQUCA|nr:hypothetical protein AQUCO_02200150v1 [Aquilegia coerulea]
MQFMLCKEYVLPTIFIFWVLGHARFSITTILFVVMFSTFVVVLPESTHAVAKRIALAQIVILYSITSVDGVHTRAHITSSCPHCS